MIGPGKIKRGTWIGHIFYYVVRRACYAEPRPAPTSSSNLSSQSILSQPVSLDMLLTAPHRLSRVLLERLRCGEQVKVRELGFI